MPKPRTDITGSDNCVHMAPPTGRFMRCRRSSTPSHVLLEGIPLDATSPSARLTIATASAPAPKSQAPAGPVKANTATRLTRPTAARNIVFLAAHDVCLSEQVY